MLKYVLFLSGLIFFIFNTSMYYMVQNMLFLMMFLLMMNNIYSNYLMNLTYFLGADLISFGLILLSVWICSLMLMASESVKKYNNFMSLFLLCILILLLLLIFTFSTYNMFLFYFFFESSLIPTMFLILGWGYQPERLQAGIYLLFYTLFASLPLLVCIFYLMKNMSLLTMFMMYKYYFNGYLYLALITAFLIKMPMFLVHLWLPKAHVEAPISGSMILAGVLLKLGGYGLLRIFKMLEFLGLLYNYIWISVSLVGGVLISFICLRQLDLKSLIAYSSVAHMGIVLSGLMTISYWGFVGSYSLMIAHGLCSSGLFCLANISYERLSSRSLLINSGLLNFMPSMSMWWFLLCISNIGAPPTLNLLGEISLLNSLISWSYVSMILLMLISFFSAAYTLFLYAYSQHGKLFSAIYAVSSGNFREYLLLFLHWLPLNFLILKSEYCLLWI